MNSQNVVNIAIEMIEIDTTTGSLVADIIGHSCDMFPEFPRISIGSITKHCKLKSGAWLVELKLDVCLYVIDQQLLIFPDEYVIFFCSDHGYKLCMTSLPDMQEEYTIVAENKPNI